MTTPYLTPPVFSWPAAPGGKLHTYQSGGTTPQATYSDAAGVTPNTNPVTLDSLGSAVVRLAVGVAYHVVLKDSTDTTTLWDADNIDNNYLSTASTVGAVLYPRTSAEIAAGITPSDYTYPPYDVRRYNVKGDSAVTDDTAAWNAIGAGTWAQNITLTTPSGFNSKITGTVTLPGPYIALMMDPSSKFTYVDPGTWNTPALVIGSDTQAIGNRDLCIGQVVTSGNTYASESCVGVQIRGAFNTNRIRLCYVQGFTVNLQIHAVNTGGVAYNTFDLGGSFDAIYHLDIHSFAANAFINENLFLNGQIQISGGYSAARVSYGIVFRAEPGAYTGNNKNHFLKPCIQITQVGVSVDRIPIWFNNSGGYNQVDNLRAEGLNGEVVRITSDAVSVNNNYVDIGFASTNNGTLTAYMTETDGGFSYANRCGFNGVPMASTWDSGDLIQKAWAPSAGNISVLGMFLQAAASANEVSLNAGKIGKDYILVTSGSLGVYVDTTFFKEFELRTDILATRGGRVTFVAYDSTGTLISSTRAVNFGGVSENANYGGHSYTQSADQTQIFSFRVDSTVKTLKVMFTAGTQACSVRRLFLTGYATQLQTAASINAGMSVYGGPFAPQEFISTAIPTALGGNFTQRGFVAWNGNAVAGNTVAAGWICTAAGWNAPAWTITTAYILNQMVVNGGNVYVCRVAGTSAGAGGPAGTGVGIVDNTVTWDYVVNGTPEPVGTNATWTALANVP